MCGAAVAKERNNMNSKEVKRLITAVYGQKTANKIEKLYKKQVKESNATKQ